ncbi:MAG: hypothetical protein IPH86_14780 [bacterium]|nr:hypothetical protein [bacterium]
MRRRKCRRACLPIATVASPLPAKRAGRCTCYVDDVLFEDDPRLTSAKKTELILGCGGSGLAAPTINDDGVQVVRRDIHLGRNIPGYPGSGRR